MFRVGIHLGGKLTAPFAADTGGTGFRTAKVMTTPQSLTEGILGAIEAAEPRAGVRPRSTSWILSTRRYRPTSW